MYCDKMGRNPKLKHTFYRKHFFFNHGPLFDCMRNLPAREYMVILLL